MNKENSLDIIEQTLRDRLEIEKDIIKSLTDLEAAKVKGMIEGIKIGIVYLEKIKKGSSDESSILMLNSAISQSIYSLMKNEEKYNKKQDRRLECKIAYYENLASTLQLLREKFSFFVESKKTSN